MSRLSKMVKQYGLLAERTCGDFRHVKVEQDHGLRWHSGIHGEQGHAVPRSSLPGATAIELLGAILLVPGWQRWAALAMFLFMIPTTLIFHNSGRSTPHRCRHSRYTS